MDFLGRQTRRRVSAHGLRVHGRAVGQLPDADAIRCRGQIVFDEKIFQLPIGRDDLRGDDLLGGLSQAVLIGFRDG